MASGLHFGGDGFDTVPQLEAPGIEPGDPAFADKDLQQSIAQTEVSGAVSRAPEGPPDAYAGLAERLAKLSPEDRAAVADLLDKLSGQGGGK